MSYLVTGEQGPIEVGATGVDAILQNVRTILTTPKGSVPLDREFGLVMDILDQPFPSAVALLTNRVQEALYKYEPRARLTILSFDQTTTEGADGKLVPVVELEIEE